MYFERHKLANPVLGKTYRPPPLDPETDGILDDYCEASGDDNKNKIVQKAIQFYVLRRLSRNEGGSERYIELRAKRAKQPDAENNPPPSG
jgi:hypothetical protein